MYFLLINYGMIFRGIKNNNFGGSKSYHVLGKYNDYYGITRRQFRSMHYAEYNDKLGMKNYSYGVSQEREKYGKTDDRQ